MSNNVHYKACPLCHDSNIVKKSDIEDYSISKEDFELWNCETCGFMFTQNVPNQQTIAPYYESEDYISHSDNKSGVVHRLYHTARQYMLKQKLKLVSTYANGKSLLDIGSGTGYFPDIMQRSGFDVLGLEINEEARTYSIEKFGLSIVPPSQFEDNKIDRKFDVVTMWHVLEHIYNLHDYLTKIKSILNDKGCLVLALPNRDSYDATHYDRHWAGYDVPRHLWHFNPNDIAMIAKEYDFEIVAKKRMPFDSFYVAMLSEKHKKSGLSLIKGSLFGGISYANSLLNTDKCSSIIYVLRKK